MSSNMKQDDSPNGGHPGWQNSGWSDSRTAHFVDAGKHPGWYSTAHLDADTVLSWNQHTLDAIQAIGSTPLYASRHSRWRALPSSTC